MAVWILWFIHSDIKPSSHRWFSQSRSAIAACIVSINVASRVSLPALHRKILRFQKISIKSKQLQFLAATKFCIFIVPQQLIKGSPVSGGEETASLTFIYITTKCDTKCCLPSMLLAAFLLRYCCFSVGVCLAYCYCYCRLIVAGHTRRGRRLVTRCVWVTRLYFRLLF